MMIDWRSMSDITRMLDRVEAGEPAAREELLAQVYDELRQLAAAKLAQQSPGQTLQATALVHEAWLRLESGQRQHWESRRHYFCAAAQAMRHILIERVRRKLRARHGGQW